MKRLIPLLLLTLTTCQPAHAMADRRKQTAPQPSDSATATYDITTGRLLASTTYGGSKAGQAQETGSDKVSEVLAGKMEPDSEFGFFKLVRYAEDQPDAAIEQRLENNEKGAVAQLSQAMSGNAPVAAIQALQSVVNNAIKEKADYKRWKESQPKPDTAGISVTGFLNGPGSHSAIALLGGKMSETISSKTRATYSVNTETVRTDTTNTNDYSGVSNVLRHQLELAKIDLEMAKIKAASQVKPPVVKPTEPKPEDPATPPPADGSTPPPLSKALSELQKIYPGAKPGGTNNKEADWTTNGNKLQWKNDSDQNGEAVVIVPFYVGATGVQVTHAGGTETATGIRNNSYGNGLRVTFQLDSTGSAYRSPVTVKLLPSGATYNVPNPGKNEGIARLKWPTFFAAPVEPVDPPPSGIDTSAAPVGGKTHELTPIGLLLRADVAATVSHVIVIEDAELNRDNPPKITAARIGNTWTTGKPLSQHRAGVYQVWFATPPPAPVTYHPDFLGRGPVGHVTQAGVWNPDTIR